MKIQMSPILKSDGYKIPHFGQYPTNYQNTFGYISSRGGEFSETVMFGLQPEVRELTAQITQPMIDAADKFSSIYFGRNDAFNREGWEYIVNNHNGYLPLHIKAVPEGSVVKTKQVLATVETTDKNCGWLESYIETRLLRSVWYGTTVATLSYHIKKVILEYLEKTGDPELLPFKLHDFGARGVSSQESAQIGGAAHLTNFLGTDTIECIPWIQENYNTDDIPGFSIVASEHSTFTSWGGENGEIKAMKNLLDRYLKPGTIVAGISDSYNIWNAIKYKWGGELKEQIIASKGTLVIRPDSGDPVDVSLKCIELLGDAFGYTTNTKSYKVLHPCVRIIYGDGIDLETIKEILENITKHGWSADNIAFGCGGGLLQKVNRDTNKFAMKTSAIQINDIWIDVFKDPITDPGKSSLKGKVSLFKNSETGEIYTDRLHQSNDIDVLVSTFLNGTILKEYTFEEVRANTRVVL